MYYEKLAATVALGAMLAATDGSAARNWTSEARERVEHTFTNDTILEVDNVTGSVDVIGDSGTTIRVDGEKIMRAESAAELERAKRDVTLDMNEKNGVAQLYVNGPFREHGHSDDHGFHERYGTYEVTYNLTVHVPRQTELRLRTVNGGLKTEQTTGKFDVRTVNGSVAMTSVAGSGTARTVNGKLTLAFNENPKVPADFSTVNGSIDATFAPNLSANLHLKTVNGDAFTDFEGTAMSSVPATKRTARRMADLRIGGGGPELNFSTVNGTVSIHKGGSK